MAIEESENKMMGSEDIKNKGISEEYFFPDHGVTVVASSKEEAEAKLLELLKAKE